MIQSSNKFKKYIQNTTQMYLIINLGLRTRRAFSSRIAFEDCCNGINAKIYQTYASSSRYEFQKDYFGYCILLVYQKLES
jgi:hypothetical protein